MIHSAKCLNFRGRTYAVPRCADAVGVVGAVVVCCSLFSPGAYAQSSVTLYGVVDSGITYTNNQSGSSAWQATSGGLASSRWGMRGKEELGGGTAAIFTLENGFNAMTGASLQNGREFGRLAFVGLTGPWGQLTLGHQNDIIIDYLLPYTASNLFAGSLGAHAGDLDNTYADFKLDNTVKYQTRQYGGFSFGALYRFGGIAGSPGADQIWGVGAKFARGPFSIGLAYRVAKDPAVSYFGGSAAAVSGQTFSNPATNPIYKGYTSAQSLKTFAVGAGYQLGQSSFNASYTATRFDDVLRTSSTPVGNISPTINTAEAAYTYRIQPNWQAGISYAYTFAEDAHYQQYTLGSRYFFSKRTSVYVVTAYQHASGTNSSGGRAVANLALLSASTTPNQVAVRVGINHAF